MAKKTKAELLKAFKAKQARDLKRYESKIAKKSVSRRRATVKAVKNTRRIKPDKPRKSLKVKAAPTRRIAKKAARAFTGGLTHQVAKGYRAIKEIAARPRSLRDKENALRRIGVSPYKGKYRKRTARQKRKISKLYSEFGEFTGRGPHKIIKGARPATLVKARKGGMATYDGNIYVHTASKTDTARMGKFMGETVIVRTYHGKTERVFLGGADVFDRVVKKLQVRKMKPGEMITGAFFGGPTFHKAIYQSVGELLNYLNNAFQTGKKWDHSKPIPQRKSARNVRQKNAALIKNIAIVTIDNPEFENVTAAAMSRVKNRAPVKRKAKKKTPAKKVPRATPRKKVPTRKRAAKK